MKEIMDQLSAERFGDTCDVKTGLIEDRWNMLEEIEMISNRCVVFPAPLYYSRYPLDWTKNYPRTVQIYYFDNRR